MWLLLLLLLLLLLFFEVSFGGSRAGMGWHQAYMVPREIRFVEAGCGSRVGAGRYCKRAVPLVVVLPLQLQLRPATAMAVHGRAYHVESLS